MDIVKHIPSNEIIVVDYVKVDKFKNESTRDICGRYLLLSESCYYPDKGIRDLSAHSHNPHTWDQILDSIATETHHYWYQIVDKETMSIIREGNLSEDPYDRLFDSK